MGSVGTDKNKFNLTALQNTKYRGIWYGADKNPISVKNLLDNVIKQEGRGFGIKVKETVTSDNLLDDNIERQVFLVSEEGRGSFRLNSDSINYLRRYLKSEYWQRKLTL